MDLRQLEHFLAVVDGGSLGRASELANVSQQGMSASIKALELSLGTILLERGRFGARPTAAGLALAEHARRILGQTRLARAEIQSLDAGESGVAAVGVGPFFAQHIIPAAIVALSISRPGIIVRAIEAPTDQIVQMLLRGEIDFGLSTPGAMLDIHPEITQDILYEDSDAPLVSADHPVAQLASPTLADLVKHPWIFSTRFAGEKQRVIDACLSADLPPPTRMVLTDSMPVVRELLRTGEFVHVSGRWQLRRCFPDLRIVPIDLPQFTSRRFGVCTKRRDTRLPLASSLLLDTVLKIWAQDEPQLGATTDFTAAAPAPAHQASQAGIEGR
ncbi:LysR family transcriptional regulator [Polymorphobacter sp.]|uniref:LysR family transcriptional regulator n=1 Tax=Polymorphobacter sp. TaxID=1909290 RepID=UPI003F717CE6